MSMLFAAAHYHDTITLGSLIVGMFIGLAGLAFVIYGVRYKAAYEAEKAVSDSLKDGRDAFKLRAERLGEEKDELQAEVGKLSGLIEELQKRPQYEDMLRMLERADIHATERTKLAVSELVSYQEKAEQRTVDAFENHEKRAQERHEAEMAVMEKILKRAAA